MRHLAKLGLLGAACIPVMTPGATSSAALTRVLTESVGHYQNDIIGSPTVSGCSL